MQLIEFVPRFDEEATNIELLCWHHLPDPVATRTRLHLLNARRRLNLYVNYSEAGTYFSAESDQQARAFRTAIFDATQTAAHALTEIDATPTPVSTPQIDIAHRLADLASRKVPTFPDTLNKGTFSLHISPPE